jgi:addiction module HigA family antidote
LDTRQEIAMEDRLKPVHPGEVLLEDFLRPMGLSQTRLALAIGVPPRRINEIVLGKRGITADTALRLARYFGVSPQFWLGLQMDYDLDTAAEQDQLGLVEVGERERASRLEEEAIHYQIYAEAAPEARDPQISEGMAMQTTYAQAPIQFAGLLDRVTANREVVVIRRRGGEDVALIAAAELDSLMETAHLLRSPANAQRLLSALVRAQRGEVEPQTVEDLRREVGLDEDRR